MTDHPGNRPLKFSVILRIIGEKRRKKSADGIGVLSCKIPATRKVVCSTFLSEPALWSMAVGYGQFVPIVLMSSGTLRVCQWFWKTSHGTISAT